ncbi:hypothetical protein D3C80_1624280 [compost metagenome]
MTTKIAMVVSDPFNIIVNTVARKSTLFSFIKAIMLVFINNNVLNAKDMANQLGSIKKPRRRYETDEPFS